MELSTVSDLLAFGARLGLRSLLLAAALVAVLLAVGLLALDLAAPAAEPILAAPVRWVRQV